MALNAAAAILVARLAGVSAAQAGEALAQCDLPPMRMEVRDIGGITVLLDAYNASPSSMEAALETLSGAPIEGAKIAVVGDMRELGDYAETAHRELAALLAKSGLAGVIAVGEWAPTIVHELEELRFGGQLIAVPDAMAAKMVLSQWARIGDAVLVKGSRSLELERVVQP